MSMANDGPTPKLVSKIKSDITNLNIISMALASEIDDAYQALGYDISHIDIQNGGLIDKQNKAS